MLKKSLAILSISAAFFVQAQDVSVIRNTHDVYSTNDFLGTAKFNAMAGSNGALGGDATALLTNPAGLGVAIADEVSISLSTERYKNTASRNNASVNYHNSTFDVSNTGGVAVIQLLTETPWKFLNFGVNYSNQSLDQYIESPGSQDMVYDFSSTNSASFAGHAYDRTGNISKTSLGIGANYNHSLYFGLGLNFLNSQLDQSDTAAFKSLQNGSLDYFSKQDTPFSELGSGFSASFGVISKVSPMLRLGLSLETPTFWALERNYNFYDDPLYGDDIATENRRLISPMKATLSAALVPNKSFSMNLDITQGITRPSYKVFGPAETELNSFFKENYNSMTEVKLGAEYRMNKLRIRGGYALTKNPFDAISIKQYANAGNTETQNYDQLLLGQRNLLSFGLGYDFKSFYIDAAYQNMTSTFSNPFLRGVVDANNNIQSAYYSPTSIIESDAYVVSEVKSKRNRLMLTLGWKF